MIFRVFGTLSICLMVLCLSTIRGQAANCKQVNIGETAINAWFDPVAGENELLLPLTLKLKKKGWGSNNNTDKFGIVFKKVPLSGDSFFGDENAEFRIGAKKPKLFETRARVRIGSALLEQRTKPFLLIGKYEISVAQYAVVMGKGNLVYGVAKYLSASKKTGNKNLADFVDSKHQCANVISKQVHLELANPVAGLSPDKVRKFIRNLNLSCFADPECSKHMAKLSQNRDVPAYFRLPVENEWEYVARGGYSLGYGKIKRRQLEKDEPDIPVNGAFADFVVLGSNKALAIGSRKPLHGFHDLYGNVNEMTGSAFLSETLYGATGGVTVRGGHYLDKKVQFRPSARQEIQPYEFITRKSKSQISSYSRTGFRLAIGLPIIGVTKRIGSNELEQIYNAAYSELGGGADRAGNNFNEAKQLRRLSEEAEPFRDEFDSDDPADFFQVQLDYFGKIRLKTHSDQQLKFGLYDQFRQRLQLSTTLSRQRANHMEFAGESLPLLPGTYYVSLKPKAAVIGDELKYTFTVTARKSFDTGLSGAQIERGALKNAKKLSSRYTVALKGYVGRNDRFDTFPMHASPDANGVSVRVENIVTPIAVHLLNSRGKNIGTRTFRPGVSTQYPFPVLNRQPLFLQVESLDELPTLYDLHVKSVQMYPKQFSKTNSQNHQPLNAGKLVFSGYLSSAAYTLYWKFRLEKREKVRIELTGLETDVDFSVALSGGKTVKSEHRRKGSDPEVFEENLAKGIYDVKIISRKGDALIAPFELVMSTSKASEISAEEIAQLRNQADKVKISDSSIPTMVVGEGINFFKLDNIKSIIKLDIALYSQEAGFFMQIEDSSGKVLARSTKTSEQSGSLKYNVGPRDNNLYLRIEIDRVSGANNLPRLKINKLKAHEFYQPKNVHNIEKFGDWNVVAEKQRCVAYTNAVDFFPSNLGSNTYPYFRIFANRKGGWNIDPTIGLKFNKKARTIGEYATKKGWRNTGFRWGRLGFGPYVLQKGNWAINKKLRPLRKSNAFRVKGIMINGSAAKIEYSLNGMTEALNSVFSVCKPSFKPW